ncbi:MAG: hypothetical protein BWX48_00686 [Verrucomicrobia bacterium ADurb.Bin006]|nr:MAG: hypothetical protein BWX48_00686 [Verrucomicrobia bacterium ADurb.Bin006]
MTFYSNPSRVNSSGIPDAFAVRTVTEERR